MACELHGTDLDQALAKALGFDYVTPQAIGADTVSYIEAIMDGNILWPELRMATRFSEPATDVAEAIKLAMWLVDNRDWVIEINLDPDITDVSCYVGSFGSEAPWLGRASLHRPEAICLSILAAALAVKAKVDSGG